MIRWQQDGAAETGLNYLGDLVFSFRVGSEMSSIVCEWFPSCSSVCLSRASMRKFPKGQTCNLLSSQRCFTQICEQKLHNVQKVTESCTIKRYGSFVSNDQRCAGEECRAGSSSGSVASSRIPGGEFVSSSFSHCDLCVSSPSRVAHTHRALSVWLLCITNVWKTLISQMREASPLPPGLLCFLLR